jgi:hypothetical protein
VDTKDLMALTLLVLASLASVAGACISVRLREATFFLLISGVVLGERLDVNFFSHYWYRGTTRGLELSLLDVLALGVLAGSLLGREASRPRWIWPAGLLPLLLLLGWAAVSVLTAEPWVFGAFELSKMLRGVLVLVAAACFVRGDRQLAILVVALGCAVCFEGALALKQRYLDGVYRVTGSIDHPNSLSMYVCLAGPVLLAGATADWSRWLRVFCGCGAVVAALTVLLTISRAGIPIFAVTALATLAWCVSWRLTAGKVMAACLVCAALVVLTYRSWDTLVARYGEATFEEEYLDPTAEGRGLYLRLAWAVLREHPAGVGLNNWSYQVSKTYGARFGYAYEDYDDLNYAPSKEALPSFHYAAPAHNLAALTAGELGWPGLALLALVWARWFHIGQGFLWRRVAAPMHRLGVGVFFGLCGVFLQSLTEWTYRQTPILFTCHVLLGALAVMHHRRTRPPHRLPRRKVRRHVPHVTHEERGVLVATH